MGFFRKKEAKPVTMTEATGIVREVLSKLGVDSAPRVIEGAQGLAWSLQRGSAIVHVAVAELGGQVFFRVVSPIIYLPSDNLLPLYRTLLEVNMNLPNAALAINEDQVCVVSERAVAGLDVEEADEIIKRVAYYADDLDDKLAAEFGARLFSSAPR